jgi:hypothetical protein
VLLKRKLVFETLLIIFAAIAVKLVLGYLWVKLPLEDFERTIAAAIPHARILFVTIVLYPLIEELMYRLPLIPTIRHLKISFAVFAGELLFHYEMGNYFSVLSDWIVVKFAIYLSVVSWALFKMRKPNVQLALLGWTGRKPILILLFLQAYFAITHLRVYDFKEGFLPYALIIFCTYFLLGLCFSFVRLRYGFWYCVGTHMFFNAVGPLTALIVN